MTYMYIPASVTHIGHHAFWDTCYKEDGEVKGVAFIDVEADEDTFKQGELGDQWRPEYDYHLFKKAVAVNYSAARAE